VKVVFFGTGDIGLPSLEALFASAEHELLAVFTQPDKPFGRAGDLKVPGPKLFAGQNGIAIHQPSNMRDTDSVGILRRYAPDIIVVVAYGQILPKQVLEIPSIACLNLHASILPSYRGAAPIQGAILAGERESGMTVMYMDEGLDTGDILLVHKLGLVAEETGGSLHDRLAEIGPLALMEALTLLGDDRAPRIVQDHSAASHMGKLKRGDGAIDWQLSAGRICRQIHAFDPWPGSFTGLGDGMGAKIFAPVELLPGTSAPPGEIIEANRQGIIVGCGEGALRILEIQPAGSRRMPVIDFLAGRKLQAGDILASCS
jgi:methionyl-tRNA formyltransferase